MASVSPLHACCVGSTPPSFTGELGGGLLPAHARQELNSFQTSESHTPSNAAEMPAGPLLARASRCQPEHH